MLPEATEDFSQAVLWDREMEKKRGGQTPAALKMLAARGDRGFWSDGPGRAELVYSGSIRSNMVLELASILIELGGGNVMCRSLPEDRPRKGASRVLKYC